MTEDAKENLDSLSTETLQTYIKLMGKPIDLGNVVKVSDALTHALMTNSRAASQLLILFIFTLARQDIAYDIVKLIKLRLSVEGVKNESTDQKSET